MATSRTRSDTDQTRSNADQSSSAHDEAQADADKRASRRDQSVADRDRSMHASTDAMFAEAHAAIQAERERTVAEREAAADDRLRAADDRDRAADDRARAAEDRNVAAVDRGRAAIDREHASAALEGARIELEKAQLDDLTGFYRLGLGTTVLQREVDRSRRSGGELTVAYCDVDGLKAVNDEEGHAAGDALLRCFAEAIRQRLRSYDPVVRVGGDEFVCFVSGIGLSQVEKIFGDVQRSLASKCEGASMSFGLAALQDDDDLATLLERGDHALLEAKSALHAARAPRFSATATE
jgi:diguanylate cyclase (GGDEF)-like protein